MNTFPLHHFCSQDHQEFNKFTCSRYILSFIVSAIITIISTIFCIKTYKDSGSFVYELLPMLLCVLQGMIHTFQFSILNENHLTLLGNLTQIIIFSLVGFSFSQVYKRLHSNEIHFNYGKRGKFTLIYFTYMTMFLIQLLCIILTKTEQCNIYFYIALIITLIDILTTSIIILYYGNKLKKVLTLVNQRFSYNRKNSSSGSNEQQLLESELPREKIIQIKVVVYSLTINTIIYIVIILVLFFNDKDVLCNFQEDDDLNNAKNIILLIFIVTQLFPCFIVPYAFNFRLRNNVDTQIQYIYSQNCLDFQRDRNQSTTNVGDEGNDLFVQRLTRGRTIHD